MEGNRKKVTREKRLKTTRFVLISRNHTPAAAERDLWEHVCLISQPERPTKPKSDPNDVSSLGCFICWVSLISGQAKSVLTRDRPPNRSNCWTMKRKSYFLSLASHTCRKNAWTHSFRLPVMKSTLRFKKSWTRFTSQTLCASAAVVFLIGYKLTSSRLGKSCVGNTYGECLWRRRQDAAKSSQWANARNATSFQDNVKSSRQRLHDKCVQSGYYCIYIL